MVSFRYRAYISYSHHDEKWAEWLQGAIETYRIPKQLVGTAIDGRIIPKRLMPIFRDRSELTSSNDLGALLDKAISESEYMIVLCSPNAVQSRWVNEEILRFKQSREESNILSIIVDGEPNAGDCYPKTLLHRLDTNPQESCWTSAIETKARISIHRIALMLWKPANRFRHLNEPVET